MTMPSTYVRQALGEAARLGDLYDARTDSFIPPLNLIANGLPENAIIKTDIPETYSKYVQQDSLNAKLNSLDVSAQLGASFCAGLVKVDGSAKFLSERQNTSLVAQRSLIYNIKTVSEKLVIQTEEVANSLSWKVLATGAATHVVTEIEWGSRNIITAKQSYSYTDNAKAVEGALDARLSHWKNLSGDGSGSYSSANQSNKGSIEITVFGDVLAKDDVVPVDPESAMHWLKRVTHYIGKANHGKGKPLVYKLTPLALLANIFHREMSIPYVLGTLETESFVRFVQTFDDLACVQKELSAYHDFLHDHMDYVPREYIRMVRDRILEVRDIETRLKGDYARKLQAVRTAKAKSVELWQLLEDFGTHNARLCEPENIKMEFIKEKIQLLKGLVSCGAIYVGFNRKSYDLELINHTGTDVYTFHFDNAARIHTDLWKQNLAILDNVLKDTARPACVILKDHDAAKQPLSAPYIELIRNTEVIIPDVLMDRKASLQQCQARYDDRYIERGRFKPISRVTVKLPCPLLQCAPSADHAWFCAKCGGMVEYGHVDQFLYCDCGRCEYKWWRFRCSDARHGLGFRSYDDVDDLLQRLKDIEPFEVLNILILGPTGVGKSTWINAFVNYLTYETLDDALDAEKLRYIIPFAFTTYNTKENGDFEKMKISFGFSDQSVDQSKAQKVSIDEHDGTKGDSATQSATVHRVLIGKRTVRLIDTPGIGDTRGANQDKKNLADILQVLRMYSKVHGILILLKPNEQRLGLMFRFCVQELLTHLHRDAAQNIAFGFTNTRGTSYTPGDTLDPLSELLREYKGVDIALRERTVYCFDSESFRYLAARKQHNISLGHIEETRSSWEYSVKECKRLQNHFENIRPHQVDSTVNLYETRRRIFQMTEPMAEIAETMKNTVAVNKDDLKELRRQEMTKRELEQKLKIHVKTIAQVPIDRPRTTCSDKQCLKYEYTDLIGSDRKPVLGVVYKTPCHSPCFLDDVPIDQVGISALKGCWAMNNTDTCRVCSHSFTTHLHIKYEYKSGSMELDDPTVVAALESNATLRQKQEAVIASKTRLVEELELELKVIREAAAQFSVFSSKNAIVPINDATLAYLDEQIKQEQGKIQAGGSRDKYIRLEEFRQQYEQEVAILEEFQKKGENHRLLDQAGVEEMVQRLCSLKHYGRQFCKVRENVDVSEAAPSREKSHYIIARKHWTEEKTRNKGDKPKGRDAEFGKNIGIGTRFRRLFFSRPS